MLPLSKAQAWLAHSISCSMRGFFLEEPLSLFEPLSGIF